MPNCWDVVQDRIHQDNRADEISFTKFRTRREHNTPSVAILTLTSSPSPCALPTPLCFPPYPLTPTPIPSPSPSPRALPTPHRLRPERLRF